MLCKRVVVPPQAPGKALQRRTVRRFSPAWMRRCWTRDYQLVFSFGVWRLCATACADPCPPALDGMARSPSQVLSDPSRRSVAMIPKELILLF